MVGLLRAGRGVRAVSFPQRPSSIHRACSLLTRYRCCAALLLAHCCLPWLHAQSSPRYLLEETSVRSGMESGFEAAQKDYCAAVVRGGAPECIVFSPTTFSPGGEYLTLIGFGSFSHYDEGTYTSKGLTPEQASKLRERREPAIAANRESGLALLPDVSYQTPATAPLMLITDLTIAPGTLPELLRYLRLVEIPAAHSEAIASFQLYQVVAGGATNRFLLMRGMKSFAQMDRVPPFGDSLENESDHASRQTIVGCVLQVRSTIMRQRTGIGSVR